MSTGVSLMRGKRHPTSGLRQGDIRPWRAARHSSGGGRPPPLLAEDVPRPGERRRHRWEADGRDEQEQGVVDLGRRRARFLCPSDVAVHRTLGADRRGRRKLDQVGGLVVQRPRLPGGFTEGLDGSQKTRVLLLQRQIRLRRLPLSAANKVVTARGRNLLICRCAHRGLFS